MSTLDISVAASSDDCYQSNDNPPYLTDAFIQVGRNSGNQYHGGYRFLNITVLKDAIITVAYLRVRAYSSAGLGSLSAYIYGVAADDPPTWSDNYRPAGTTNAAPLTSANVSWGPGTFDAGTWYNSPDISAIISEITSRAGWASANALSLSWKCNYAGSGSPAYVRTYTWNGSSPAELHIEYTNPAPPTSPFPGGR